MGNFVNTSMGVKGIADIIQQHFATSHTKITHLHHMDKLNMKAICGDFQIRREGKYLSNLTTNCSLNVNNKFLFILSLTRIKCEPVLTTQVPSRELQYYFLPTLLCH